MTKFKTTVQTYLNKFSDTTKLIDAPIDELCKLIVVIPSYNETDLDKTLLSLKNTEKTKFPVEVIVVLNCSLEDKEVEEFHLTQLAQLKLQFSMWNNIRFHFILAQDLSPKHAGVGLARKIGMDEAVRRFLEIETDGMIVCLDADCEISSNYLIELENLAVDSLSYNSVCIHFEHLYEQETNLVLREGIIYYELFLRYYKECLKWINFPYAFHTIGSSMAVKTSIYCKSGGMNKRKAGEDFYFLHKVFHYGNVIELNSVTVFPSCRISKRVPFGTGRAQQNFTEHSEEEFRTYDFSVFAHLKAFFNMDLQNSGSSFNVEEETLNRFLKEIAFEKMLTEVRKNSTTEQGFKKRFFNVFDGFLVLKYIHFARDNGYPNKKLIDEVNKLFEKIGLGYFQSEEICLLELRRLQKQ